MGDQATQPGVLVHKNRLTTGGYASVALPEVEGHDLVKEIVPGRCLASCSCDGWRRSDGCGPCINQAFIDHVADVRASDETAP